MWDDSVSDKRATSVLTRVGDEEAEIEFLLLPEWIATNFGGSISVLSDPIDPPF